MKTLKDFKNELLNRRELKVLVHAQSNPGHEKAKEMISNDFKVLGDLVAVKTLKSKFGRDTFLIDAFVYDSKADKEKVEPKIKIKKVEGQ